MRFTAFDKASNERFDGIRFKNGEINLYTSKYGWFGSIAVTEEKLQKYYRVVEK